jgi:predicted nuclease of restriction endonuclease-like RecB superfamily
MPTALPTALLCFTQTDGELVPAWLSDRDRPWLRDLLDDARAAIGRPWTELARHWRRSDPDPRAGRRTAIAQHAVLAHLRGTAAIPRMAGIRLALFQLAANGIPTETAVTTIAQQQGLPADQLLTHLFADLPGERRIVWPDPPFDPSFVILLANRLLVQGMLRHASAAELTVHGATRSVLRTAWLQGNGLVVHGLRDDRAELRWWNSNHRLATRSLTALVPTLPWTRRYTLRAACRVRHEAGTLILTTGDAILPGPEPRQFDSALERDFARDFAATAPGWRLLREPVPIQLAHGLAFPDFEVLRTNDQTRWLLEIAGLRDPAALPQKLALLGNARTILCLPRAHVPHDLRTEARIVPFGRRVIATEVLATLDRLSPPEAAC